MAKQESSNGFLSARAYTYLHNLHNLKSNGGLSGRAIIITRPLSETEQTYFSLLGIYYSLYNLYKAINQEKYFPKAPPSIKLSWRGKKVAKVVHCCQNNPENDFFSFLLLASCFLVLVPHVMKFLPSCVCMRNDVLCKSNYSKLNRFRNWHCCHRHPAS